MTRKHQFRPVLNDQLEDRIALSHAGTVAAAASRLTSPPVVRQSTIDSVGHSVDSAFNRFRHEYDRELATLNRTHNAAQFQAQLSQSVGHLRSSLSGQAARFPKGSDTLNTELQHRVDSLASDLENSDNNSSADNQIESEQSSAHDDLNTFVHDEVAKGDFSVR